MNQYAPLPVFRALPQLNQWQLREPLIFEDTMLGTFIAQDGLITDLNSSPAWSWLFVGAPMRDRRSAVAAVFHDELYRTNGLGGKFTRQQCDDLYYRILLSGGFPKWRACLKWLAVIGFGWLPWRSYAPNQHEPMMLHYERTG